MTGRANGEGTVYKRADGRWEGAALLTLNTGQRKRVRIYGATRADVHARLNERIRKERQGILSPAKSWRLGDYLDYWLPIAKNTRRPTTYTSYEMITRLYLKPLLGQYSLTRLTVAVVQQAFMDQLAEGRSVRTVQKMRTVLSATLTRAQSEELITRNVAHHIELPTWHRRTITPWTLEQAKTFLTAAKEHPWQAAFLLLIVYGMRRSEVLGLRWQDIDYENQIIHVEHQILRVDGKWELGPVKTNSGQRDLPLLPLVALALQARREPDSQPDDLVFQTQFGTPIEGGNLLRAFTRISEQAGLPRITLHHLRHTAATFLKNAGLPARDTQLVLGHAHITTTQQLYQHADMTSQANVLAMVQRAVVDETDSLRCRQTLPSNAKIGPSGGPIRLVSSLVAPPRLELGTQGSSGLEIDPFPPGITGVAPASGGSQRSHVKGPVAVSVAVRTALAPVIDELRVRTRAAALGSVATAITTGANLHEAIAATQSDLNYVRELESAIKADAVRARCFPYSLVPTAA